MRSWFLAAVLMVAACGDDGKRGIDNTNTSDNDATTATSTPDTSDDTAEPMLENACDEAHACSRGACRSGVCVDDPPSGLESHATNPIGNIPTDELPDLSCVDEDPSSDAAPAEETATLYGAVARFGKGRSTVGIVVEVMRADSFDPSACEALDPEDEDAVKACYRGTGTVIGSSVAVDAPDSTSLPEECSQHEQCPLGYQCDDPHELGGECKKDFGLYEIANVPVNVPLIIRSYSDAAETVQRQWHDTWLFNIVLHSHHVADGRVQYDATMVSEGQWLLVSNTVQEPKTPATRGVIGGRVRDCRGDAETESWPISNASLDLANRARKIVFFNDLEDDTVPLIDRETTDVIGRFAALDVAPGWNRIAGSARVNGSVVSIGGADVYVIPNSLSIVSWPGTQPHWRQSE